MSGRAELRFFLERPWSGLGLEGEWKGTMLLLCVLGWGVLKGGFSKTEMWNRGKGWGWGWAFFMLLEMPRGFIIRIS